MRVITAVTARRVEWTRRLLARPRPEAIPILRYLQERGLATGLITVCSEDLQLVWEQTPPVQIGPNGKDSAWVTWWTYPTWITLQSGDSLTSVWTGELAHPISDGLGNISSGDMLGGNDTCTITAA
jgi:hypothetical protein